MNQHPDQHEPTNQPASPSTGTGALAPFDALGYFLRVLGDADQHDDTGTAEIDQLSEAFADLDQACSQQATYVAEHEDVDDL